MKRGKRKEEGKDETIEKMDGKRREKEREREMKTGEEEEEERDKWECRIMDHGWRWGRVITVRRVRDWILCTEYFDITTE